MLDFIEKFVQHGLITIAIDCNVLSLLIFKENGLIMPLDQNPHQTVTSFGCVGCSMYACAFSVSQMQQFCLFTYPPRSKWASSEKIIFFAQIAIFCKPIADPFSEAKMFFFSKKKNYWQRWLHLLCIYFVQTVFSYWGQFFALHHWKVQII